MTSTIDRLRAGERWAFLGILLLAAALRVWGMDYGLPNPLARPDEERIDALYLPYTGLGSVSRGGPRVRIWQRAAVE